MSCNAIDEAIKLAGYRSSGIEGTITQCLPDPAGFIDRALQLIEHNKEHNIKYEFSLVMRTGEVNAFIDKTIDKYNLNIDNQIAKQKASKAMCECLNNLYNGYYEKASR
jgi:hypothetical protein